MKRTYDGLPRRHVPADLLHRLRPPTGVERTPLAGGTRTKPLIGAEANWEYVRRILENSDILVSTTALEKGWRVRTISVTTTPVQVADGRWLRGYIFKNPAPATPLTQSVTLLSSAQQAASGNTQANPVGVDNFNTVRLFLNVTVNAAARSILVNTQSRDSLSLGWATTQNDVFTGPTTVATFYASIGSVGVDRNFAISWTVGGAGALPTWSLSAVLKDGLPGSASGTNQSIFLGTDAGVSTSNGFPLLEGQELKQFLRDNTQIWAVSNLAAGVSMTILEFQ